MVYVVWVAVAPGRRWEAKFDAKGFKQHSISIRCTPPHGKKKVPLHYDAWLMYMDTGAENCFASCQLVQDRLGLVVAITENFFGEPTPLRRTRSYATKLRTIILSKQQWEVFSMSHGAN